MASSLWGERNVGTKPEFKEISSGNNELCRLLRLNVYFDNLILKNDGEYEERGGYRAGVEVWCKGTERDSAADKTLASFVQGECFHAQ